MFSRVNTDEELDTAIGLMREVGTDLSDYELKEAGGGFPSSVVASLCAFANTSGGVVILGISEKSFEPVKELDVKTLQSQLAQCARERINPPLDLDIQVLHYHDKPVVVANVAELDIKQKPCYVKKLGRPNGSYLRTGDGDHNLTLYEIDRFVENQNRVAQNDILVIPDATMQDLDNDLIQGWLAVQRTGSFGRASQLSDEQLFVNRRVAAYAADGSLKPTLAGLCALGVFPQKFFPRLNVVFSSFPTTLKGDVATGGKRFEDSENVDGPIPAMLLGTLRAISRNIKHGAIVKDGLRENVPDYPLDAVREAVANALMHRDYSLDAQGIPVRVELYPDRLEIINPGGLFGPLTVDALGKRGSTQSRNQFLARILEDAPYTDVDGLAGRVVENRGTGYSIIEGSLSAALMEPPVVQSDLNEFRIIFRHRRMTEQEENGFSQENTRRGIVAFLAARTSASTSEIAAAAGISQKTVRGYINSLIDEGLVEGIGSKYSPKRRYRIVE
jgi:ATP-dependent DNA helicase RecG